MKLLRRILFFQQTVLPTVLTDSIEQQACIIALEALELQKFTIL
jgi:hypothetical protein